LICSILNVELIFGKKNCIGNCIVILSYIILNNLQINISLVRYE